MRKLVIILFCVIILLIILLSFNVNSVSYGKATVKVVSELASKGKAKVVVETNDNKVGAMSLKNSIKSYSAEINQNDLAKLVADDNVKDIYYDYPVHAFLQTATPLINATTTWNVQISGINLTGAGETICIIDTGVNYSNPDLGGCYGNNNASSSCKVLGGYDFVNNDADPYDDNGHGTHVSGIIAANGAIKGVAPDAKIIMIKALDSSGSGSLLDIIAGINWCVGNSSLYNISVISMSLGTDALFSTYCDDDSNFASLRSAVNSAILKNISVIVASGNSGNTTAISAPACIQNATAVGATYDSNFGGISWTGICTDSSTSTDKIACFSDRNNITDLFAPGAIINSTWLSGYAQESGTSMATPMVAGTFALVRQFKILEKNETLTPVQIQNALNSTGKIIHDSVSGLYFSRVDIYSAILSLDEAAPAISLVSPSNNTISTNLSQVFSCNATDLQLANLTLRIYNNSGLYYNNTQVVSGMFDQKNFSRSLSYDNFNWNCYSCDLKNNCQSSGNFSLNILSLITNLITPDNSYFRSSQNFSCNASALSSPLTNITFYLWNSSLAYNQTKSLTGTYNSTNFTVNFANLQEGNYSWNCYSGNNASYYAFAPTNFSFVYDKTSPAISLVSPLNLSLYNGLLLNISLDEPGACWFSLDSDNNVSMSGLSYTNTTLNDGQYNLTVYCNDTAGNLNTTYAVFNVSTEKPVINLSGPDDGYTLTASSTNINFQFDVEDNITISECKLIMSDITENTTAITNGTNVISKTLAYGSYSWQINCTDAAGNEGNSSTRSLVINQTATSNTVSSSGGGGGGPSPVAKINVSNTSENTSVTNNMPLYSSGLGVNDKLSFKLDNNTDYLIIDNVGLDNVTVSFSDNTSLVLKAGEQRNVTLGNYNVEINVNWISGGRVSINAQASVIETGNSEKNTNLLNNKRYISLTDVLIVAGIIILAVILFLGEKYAKKKRKKY